MSTHKPKGTYADYQAYISDPKNNPIDDKKFVFELCQKPTDATLKDPDGKPVQFPVSIIIPMSGSIFHKDPVSGIGHKRRIRYVEGWKTIFEDEQLDAKGNALVNPKKVVAEFIRGKKEIDGTDTVLLSFFMNWDMNESKADRDTTKTPKFKLVDTSKLAKAGRELDKQQFDAVSWCYNAPMSKIMAVATLVMTHEQLMQNTEDIRYNLVNAAKRNAAKLLELMNDPKTEKNYVVRQAIERNILIINPSLNAICYPMNPNAPLSVADAGKDPVIDFVYKTLTSVDVQKYYVDIANAVAPPVEQTKTVAYSEPVKEIKYTAPAKTSTTVFDEAELKSLYETGLAKGVIEQKPPYWKKYKGMSAKNEADFITKLKENPPLLNLLRHDLEEVIA